MNDFLSRSAIFLCVLRMIIYAVESKKTADISEASASDNPAPSQSEQEQVSMTLSVYRTHIFAALYMILNDVTSFKEKQEAENVVERTDDTPENVADTAESSVKLNVEDDSSGIVAEGIVDKQNTDNPESTDDHPEGSNASNEPALTAPESNEKGDSGEQQLEGQTPNPDSAAPAEELKKDEVQKSKKKGRKGKQQLKEGKGTDSSASIEKLKKDEVQKSKKKGSKGKQQSKEGKETDNAASTEELKNEELQKSKNKGDDSEHQSKEGKGTDSAASTEELKNEELQRSKNKGDDSEHQSKEGKGTDSAASTEELEKEESQHAAGSSDVEPEQSASAATVEQIEAQGSSSADIEVTSSKQGHKSHQEEKTPQHTDQEESILNKLAGASQKVLELNFSSLPGPSDVIVYKEPPGAAYVLTSPALLLAM